MKRTVVGGLGFGCVMAALQGSNYVAALVIVAVLLFFAMKRRTTRSEGYSRVRGHTHDGPVARVSLHEGGHLAAMRIVGGRIIGARVSGNDRKATGYAEGYIPNDPASRIGVHLAGLAAAPDTTSPSDERQVRHVLAGVPSPYRGMILREGQRIAAKAGRSSDARSYAKQLERKGRL